MSAWDWTLTERDVEYLERFAAEHGIPSLLDYLELDGLGNDVRELHARIAELERLLAERDQALEEAAIALSMREFDDATQIIRAAVSEKDAP